MKDRYYLCGKKHKYDIACSQEIYSTGEILRDFDYSFIGKGMSLRKHFKPFTTRNNNVQKLLKISKQLLLVILTVP